MRRTFSLLITTVVGAGLGFAAPACTSSGACTLIGCEGGFAITVEAEPTAGEDYSIVVTADGNQYTGSCRPGADSCSFDVADGQSFAPWLEPTATGFVIHVFDESPPGDSDVGGPEMVQVQISLGGESWEQSYTPEYERSEPNGPDCGYCDFAEVELSIIAENN